jgi:hypothetical protein
LENLVLISKAPPQYFGHFSSKIAINRRSTFQKFATFGKFFAKAEIADKNTEGPLSTKKSSKDSKSLELFL